MSNLVSVVGKFSSLIKNDLCEDSSIDHVEFFESFIKHDLLGTKANVLFVYNGNFNKKNVLKLLSFIASLEQDLISLKGKSFLSAKLISIDFKENFTLTFNPHESLSSKDVRDLVALRKQLSHTKLIYSKITKKITLCSLTYEKTTQYFGRNKKHNGVQF
jgi:hypothetical protein